MASAMEVLKKDGETLGSPHPGQIPLASLESAAMLPSKPSTAPLPLRPSLMKISAPTSSVSQLGSISLSPLEKQHLVTRHSQEVSSLSTGMPANLKSLPTHQLTIMPKPPAETMAPSNVNHNKDMVLRSGKWTPEEELYANILIELFEEGCVDEFEKKMNRNFDPRNDDDNVFKVSNGMTLRAYLSKKLFCSPMRISKKFAGRGIGKLVYMSQRSGSNKGFQQRFPYGSRRIYNSRVFSLPSDIHVTKLNRLKEAESNFLNVAFPNEIPPQMVGCLDC